MQIPPVAPLRCLSGQCCQTDSAGRKQPRRKSHLMHPDLCQAAVLKLLLAQVLDWQADPPLWLQGSQWLISCFLQQRNSAQALHSIRYSFSCKVDRLDPNVPLRHSSYMRIQFIYCGLRRMSSAVRRPARRGPRGPVGRGSAILARPYAPNEHTSTVMADSKSLNQAAALWSLCSSEDRWRP